MLNLTITMRSIWLMPLGVVWLLLVAAASPTPTPEKLSLTSPRPGEALQGVVTIQGTTAIAGYASAEVQFAYSQSKSKDWFLIENGQQPVVDGIIATFDTTTITDGVYDLRLVASLVDGSQQKVEVDGLRVRNYSLIEADTPGATLTQDATQPIIATRTVTPPPVIGATRAPTRLPLPVNPVRLGGNELVGSLLKGGLAVLGMFLFAGLYLALKSLHRP